MKSAQNDLNKTLSASQVLACVRDVVTVIDKTGKIEFINYVLAGYQIDKVIGTSIYDYFDKSAHSKIQKAIEHTWNTGEDGLYDVEYDDDFGRHIWYETRMQAQVSNGVTEHIIQTSRDMTLGHKINQDLNSKKEELEMNVEARTKQLTEVNYELSRKNQALKEVFSQLEEEKKNLEQNIIANFESVLLPILARLKRTASPEQSELFTIMEEKLRHITSSYGVQISTPLKALSPSEIQVCNLIRSGMKTKDIARILKCSNLTIDTHRTKIRKKLGISNQQVNLETFLQSLR